MAPLKLKWISPSNLPLWTIWVEDIEGGRHGSFEVVISHFLGKKNLSV
jgi:hypothetical protein